MARANRDVRARARGGATAAAVPSATDDRWPLLLAVLFSLGAGAVQFWLVRDLRQLPSVLFGGDWTYQEACIRAILVNRDPMAACSSGHALPGYLPLYGTLVALFVSVTGLDVEPAMLAMSVILHALSTLVVYLVIARSFGRLTGLAMACLWRLAAAGLIVKYTEFTSQLLVPLYFDALLRLARAPRPRPALYLGGVLAALGYAHPVAFVGGIAVATGTTLASAWWRRGERGLRRELLAGGGALAIVAACSLLALGYWWRPLFEYHGRTSPHYAEWNGAELVRTLAQRLGFAARLAGRMAWGGGVPGALLRLLELAAVLALLRAPVRARFAPVVVVAAVTCAWIFHFLVSVPLLHTHFVPEYVRTMLWPFAALLLAAIPVMLACDRLRSPGLRRAAGIALLVASLAGLAALAGAISRSPAMVYARTPLPPQYLSLQSWVLANTRPDDVVLSTNELSFGWCVLSGRKALVSRRAQNDPYLDLDARNKDAAILLYGHDDAMRRECLARWRIDYMLWTLDWIPTEFGLDARGNPTTVDPLLYFPDPGIDAEMRRAGVDVDSLHGWVDPRLRGPDYPTFDLRVIGPGNYFRPDHPWNPQLDRWLEPAWSYRQGGRVVAALYRVRAADDPVTPAR